MILVPDKHLAEKIARNRRRIAGELRVVRRVVRDLLAAEYSISVFDGEEQTVTKSEEFKEIMGALMTTDEDRLFVHKEGCNSSFVRFVYGNDAWKVIRDCGATLNDVLKGAFEVCDQIERNWKTISN